MGGISSEGRTAVSWGHGDNFFRIRRPSAKFSRLIDKFKTTFREEWTKFQKRCEIRDISWSS
jgi:hypothetical protein